MEKMAMTSHLRSYVSLHHNVPRNLLKWRGMKIVFKGKENGYLDKKNKNENYFWGFCVYM